MLRSSSTLFKTTSASFSRNFWLPAPLRTPMVRPSPAERPIVVSATVSPIITVWLGQTSKSLQMPSAVSGSGFGLVSWSSPQTILSIMLIRPNLSRADSVPSRLSVVQIAVLTPFSLKLSKIAGRSPRGSRVSCPPLSKSLQQLSTSFCAFISSTPLLTRTETNACLISATVAWASSPPSE